MLFDNPQNLLFLVGGAFLLGWLVGKVGSWMGRRLQSTRRDPRDYRIRSTDAELRIARSELAKAKETIDAKQAELARSGKQAGALQHTIDDQLARLERVRQDLKDSVQKTNELRAELSDRAAENLKSEVKLREVETELSVVQASSDLIATGVLDYSFNDDEEILPKTATPGK